MCRVILPRLIPYIRPYAHLSLSLSRFSVDLVETGGGGGGRGESERGGRTGREGTARVKRDASQGLMVPGMMLVELCPPLSFPLLYLSVPVFELCRARRRPLAPVDDTFVGAREPTANSGKRGIELLNGKKRKKGTKFFVCPFFFLLLFYFSRTR